MASVNVIEAKYRRARMKARHTFLWTQSDADVKVTFQRINLEEGELYIIVYQRSSDYSWVFTNRRLIVIESDKSDSYPYTMINDVLLPTINEIKQGKSEIESLQLILSAEMKMTLFVEKNTWHFIYALLKFLRKGNVY